MSHAKGHLRQPIIDAFDAHRNPAEDEIIRELGGTARARVALTRLWSCTDQIPGDIRDVVEDWPGYTSTYTYGSLAQRLVKYLNGVVELKVGSKTHLIPNRYS